VLWCVNSGVLRPDPGTTEAVIMIAKALLLPRRSKPFAIMENPRALGAPKISRWCAKRVRASGWS
jgi:hypothetical protein